VDGSEAEAALTPSPAKIRPFDPLVKGSSMEPGQAQQHLPLWMEYAKVFVTPVVSFFAAILGLWLASRLTEIREGKKEKIRIEKEAIYIAILLTAHLDKVVTSCLNVTYDDGTIEGRPAGDDGQTYQSTTSAPVFESLKIECDWRVLPTELMQGVLELSHKIERLNNKHAEIAAAEGPPDYGDYFLSRQYDFAKLGLETAKLMSDLRIHAGIPFAELKEGEWTRNDCFTEKIEDVKKTQREYDERQKARIAEFGELFE
jgi:hypothetical protein